MPATARLQSLVDQMPDPDGRDMFTESIDKDRIEKAIAQIAEGGREAVEGLIQMLGPPGSDQDVKPHYALHCLANYFLVVGDEAGRRQLAETLAAELEADHPAWLKAFLCQELQWAGRGEAAPALGKLLLDEALTEPASMALVAIGDGAAEQFRSALPEARGKCRLNVIQGLGAVGDGRWVEALRAALSDPDREVRLAAGWGLARIADPDSVDALLAAADTEPGWERIQATKHCLVLAENLAAAGNRDSARKIYNHLRRTRTDPSEAYIRLAATKALAAR